MSFHAYRINELYSSTDGKVQFIELNVGSSNGESFWQGVSISSASNGTTHIFTFPNNLPSTATSNTSVLIATQGFVDLGIMSPDFIVPAGFLFPAGGTLNFGGVDVVTYAQLPLNGTLSVNRVGEQAKATPTNFAGAQGSLPATQIVPTITGTAGDDVLVGTVNAEIINGLAGDDTLKGGGGADVMNGGSGADLVYSGTGNDTIDGGDGYDYLYFSDAPAGVSINLSGPVGVATGGAGADTIVGVELIFGSKFNDTFVAGDNPVGFLGDDGNDTITGGAGDDHLEGNAGDDVIDGAGGIDTIAYYSAAFAVNVNLSAGTATGGLGKDTVRNVENVIASVFSDTLTGDAFSNRLEGGTGNDTIDGAGGTDTAIYTGKITDYFIKYNRALGTATITDHRVNADGTDSLKSIEKLQFADKTFDLLNPARTESAAFGKSQSFLFDPAYYLLKHPDLVPTVTLATAFDSYKTTAAQGAAPNAWFDPVYYANRWADLKPLNLDAVTLFAHYNLYGVWEGRSAGPTFDKYDGTRYLKDNPDVAAYVDAYVADFLGSRSNGAIAHYVIYGAAEGRVAYDTAGVAIEQAILVGVAG